MPLPNWRTKKEVKVEDTAKVLEQERKNKEFYLKQATTAAMGNRYGEAEEFLEMAGWPIEREQTVAPPSEESMTVRGPGAAQGRSGRALFTAPGGQGGAMSPGDQTKDPAGLMKMLTDRFAADKGYPTEAIDAPVGKDKRIVRATPEGEYDEKLGVYEKEETATPYGGTKGWPQVYYNEAGEPRTVENEKESKAAIADNFHPMGRPPEKKKDEKYEPRTLYKKNADGTVDSWEVTSGEEEIQAMSDQYGFSPIKPGETEQSDKNLAAEKKNKTTSYKTLLSEIRNRHKGMEKWIDAILKNLDSGKGFDAIQSLAKNGYERLVAKAKDKTLLEKDPEEYHKANKDLALYEAIYGDLMALHGYTFSPKYNKGAPPPGDEEGSAAALGGKSYFEQHKTGSML